MTSTDQKPSENIIGVNPEDYRTCSRCTHVKPILQFRLVPSGKRASVCIECTSQKLKENRELETTDEGRRIWIIDELIKQYRVADKNTDKIRCLEALAKLQPPDQKTPIDDPSVIQSIVRSLKEKKKREAQVTESREDAGTNEPTENE